MNIHSFQMWTESSSWWQFLGSFVFVHLVTLIGFLLALLIVGRMFNEKRNPGNIFAWALAIFFVPYVSVPLYFLFGGYKNQRLVRNKKATLLLAAEAAGENSPKTLLHKKWPGNSFHLLDNGQIAMERLYHEINNAQESIWIMTYIIGNDSTGQEIVKLLAQRAREGIDVKLMVDAFGSFGKTRKFLDPIREAGGQAIGFMPVLPLQTKTSANLRNHRKIAIFDAKRAIVGGQNLDERFLGNLGNPKLFLDFSAVIEGPAVTAMIRIFLSDWCYANDQNPEYFRNSLAKVIAPAGESLIEVIASGPDGEQDALWEKLIKLTQDSKHHIDIVTPYFVPDEVLFQTLLIKARAGHSIRLIVPKKSNQMLVDFARHYYLRKLHNAGVKVLLYENGMLHAKLFLVDNELAMLGSANMDIRSMFVNFEIGVFMNSQEPVNELINWMVKLLPNCIAYEDSKYVKVGENRRIIEDFTHLLVPLL